MAEIWPRLKTKLSGNSKRKSGRRTKSKANPYSSSGLEKFAALLEGIQANKGASLVERTASSLSAARSISRSAQEWTAATLVRSASRRSSEPKLAAFEALAPTKVVENLEKDVKYSSKDVENSSEERQPQEASSPRPVGIRSLPERRTSSRCQLRSKSKSAFVVLLAMGTFISSQFDKLGKPLAAVLTLSAVIQVWHKGMTSARFMFSSLMLYFLTPLRSYLVTRMPTRLNLLPRNSNVILATEEEPRNSEIVISQLDSSLGFPAESAAEESAPSPILLPIQEASASTLVPRSTGASSTSRQLAKKISSRFKKLKMFRSSSSSSPSTLSVSEGSHHSTVSEPSSPDRHRMCPFSKRARSVTELEDPSSSRKCIVMRRQRSSDSMVCKKSKLGRRLSSETLEEYNLSESSVSSSFDGKPASEDVGNASSSRNEVSWPVVGLLITLLFLLVGRFPAIMATSLFFVVVSNAHHDRAHSRGRDNNRALEAARKLQRSPQRWTSPLRR